jgi:hypothetical protein
VTLSRCAVRTYTCLYLELNSTTVENSFWGRPVVPITGVSVNSDIAVAGNACWGGGGGVATSDMVYAIKHRVSLCVTDILQRLHSDPE